MASDSGSQFGPFQNSAMGYDEINIDQEMPLQTFSWTNLILGKRKKQLEDNHIFMKIVSGAHKHLTPIESCVAILKTTLASLDQRMSSTLDVYQWNYILRLTERVVLTRPLASSKTGRLWTPGCLLNLMGRCQNDDIADFRPEALSDVVMDQLQTFEGAQLKIKEEVACILLDTLIYPSFFERLTHDEKIKRRTKASQIHLSDIFLCPIIFSKTFHTSKSLLRLVYQNDAGTGGVFVKTGGPQKDKIVTRDFSYLYFICEGTRDTILSENWRPTFNICDTFQKITPNKDLCFEDLEEQEITKFLDIQPDPEVEYDLLMGNQPEPPEGGGAEGREGEGDGDQGGGPEIDSDIGGEMLFSKFGRRLKKTKFFGI